MGNSYIGGKKDPLVFEGVKGVYSVGNTWMYNCIEDRRIEDITAHSEYMTPPISSSTKKMTLNSAGCLTKSRWESLVVQ